MRVRIGDHVGEASSPISTWLRRGEHYVVLAVELHHTNVAGYRIESDLQQQPVVFEASEFEIVDKRIPSCWTVQGLVGATLELGPAAFWETGFWTRYFDGEMDALTTYRRLRDEMLKQS